jgi:hypothetical protein
MIHKRRSLLAIAPIAVLAMCALGGSRDPVFAGVQSTHALAPKIAPQWCHLPLVDVPSAWHSPERVSVR